MHRDIGKRLEVRKTVAACLGEPNHVTRLEHAQARLTLSYNRRGDLAIHLVSPMGTRSTLLAARCLPYPLPGSSSLLPHMQSLMLLGGSHKPNGHQRLLSGDTVGILGGTVLSCGTVPYHRSPWLLPMKCW